MCSGSRGEMTSNLGAQPLCCGSLRLMTVQSVDHIDESRARYYARNEAGRNENEPSFGQILSGF